MAKIRVLGDAAVVTSSLRMADIEKLNKFKPSALVIKNEDKDEVYRIAVSKHASFDSRGVTFNSTNEAGCASVTLTLPRGMTKEQKKAYITDTYALATLSLNTAEKSVNDELKTLSTEISQVENAVSFVDEPTTKKED